MNAAELYASELTKVSVPEKFTIAVTITPALSGVNLILKQNGTTKAIGTTDVDGSYTFTSVNLGNYTVTASKTGITFDADPVAGMQNPVNIAVGPDQTINFTHPYANYLVRILSGAVTKSYATLQSAADEAFSGDFIQTQATSLNENLNFSSDISVTLKGGYNSDFTSQTGYTTIIGSLIISNGTVTVENMLIQ
jgi:hypothetical protein